MEELDRTIVNGLKNGFPICDRPYAAVAAELGIDEQELIERLQRLLEQGTLSRFGPMYHAERMGGALTLCAMKIPPTGSAGSPSANGIAQIMEVRG